ncbi:MAG: lytic transglycosylase domain-containing protein [Actinobacteria bacterium]|nr:lytic transglycosylase domain-containing protein [Actinomycetota bacterium]
MSMSASGYVPYELSRISAVGTAVSSLGGQISGAASSGDFAQVLAAVQSVYDALATVGGGSPSSGSSRQGAGTGTGGAGGAGNGSLVPGYGSVAGTATMQPQVTSGGAGGGYGAGGAYGVGSGYGAASAGASGVTGAALISAGVPASLVPVFQQAAANYGISPAMLAAVAKVESGFDPSAVSSAGAQGIMQIMPSLSSQMGIDPYNPVQAIDAGAAILSDNLKVFGGSIPLALAAYNAGQGAVKQYGGIPPYPQTQDYVTMVEQVMAQMGGG